MKKFIYSPFLSSLSKGKKLAVISLFTALSVVTNCFLEIRIISIQYSLTIFFSFLSGIFLGPVFGFASCFLGDFLGYVINSWGQLYMPWVGISTGVFALASGFIFSRPCEKTTTLLIKTALFILSSFLICTVLINSGGFYLYNKHVVGLKDAFYAFTENLTGKRQDGFIFYVIYRLFFLGQIFNSLVNYALIIIAIPILKKLPLFKNII